MAISVSLSNALSGLQTAQSALTTVSHNIANVNTPGYVRKTAEQVSVALGGFGAGVTISEIRRQVADHLLRDMRNVTSSASERETREEYLIRIERLFGQPGSDSAIGSRLSRLRSTLEALAAAPENFSLRDETLRMGREVATHLNELSRNIQAARFDADQQIASSITAVNQQVSSIADLNRQIIATKALGGDPSDLEDHRDRAISAIAEYMQVNTFARNDGSIVVSTVQGRVLVDGVLPHAITYTPQSTVIAGTNFNPITLDGIDLTQQFGSGRLAALVDQRDVSLPARTAELNRLATTLFSQMTSATLATADIAGTLTVNEANHFFAGVDPAALDNAATIRVHPDIVADPSLLNSLTATRDLADAASAENIVFSGAGQLPTMTASLSTYGNAILARLAGENAAVSVERQYHDNLKLAIAAKVGEVSGVNLDEELANMVELQKAYSASARVIQTAAEMLDVLLDLKR
jgi:flagellar hook-associated protein 1 FlgK